MSDNIVKFPGGRLSKQPVPVIPITSEHGEPRDWRSRQNVQRDIDEHIAARREYAQAAAWAAQAEAENLPAAVIETAREKAAKAFGEMNWRGRHLMITMPTDPKGLVDLLMYLEKNFTILPQEAMGRSLAFDLLHTVRLTMRAVAKYGKVGSPT
jgi:hypothetical protein